LDRAGLRTIVLEARDRIGGRIYTIHDPLSFLPLELGAEFVHGRPIELLNLIRDAGLKIYDGTDASYYMNNGQIERSADAWDLVGSILDEMRVAAKGSDQSFEQFLAKTEYDDDARKAARGYIEGFNAADASEISIQALAEETAAADEIDGDRVFRFASGYDAVPLHLLHTVPDFQAKLHLSTAVERLDWKPGTVSLRTRNTLTGEVQTWNAERAIITVPLGILQAGAIAFCPEPVELLEAARSLRFGQVFRLVMRFRKPFWESHGELQDAGFILSREQLFPTWWTTLSMRSNLLTAWSAGARADGLIGMSQQEIVNTALGSLARILGIKVEEIRANLCAAYFHDWQKDKYALGAYSYVPAGALDARRKLAVPVEDTLFFAGEATDQNGHSATVHGAIASGQRAAKQILGAVVANR
jgi:monoamine oxidase